MPGRQRLSACCKAIGFTDVNFNTRHLCFPIRTYTCEDNAFVLRDTIMYPLIAGGRIKLLAYQNGANYQIGTELVVRYFLDEFWRIVVGKDSWPRGYMATDDRAADHRVHVSVEAVRAFYDFMLKSYYGSGRSVYRGNLCL